MKSGVPLYHGKVARRMYDIRKLLFICLAGVSFSLGVVGLFLPIMPTTCFMLVAVWAASKSSPRFANWIRRHPRFGPSILAWERERAIPRHAKWMACAMLIVSMGVIAFTVGSLVLRVALIIGLMGIAVWILTRPTPSLGRCPVLSSFEESAPSQRQESR
ncbi:YbaN family protein [Chromohalobacter sp. 296-RDG]|uniref:YbaN family protein n=1 Tax=Chromohalobacter sp. 296-RDG TaxID=2994062 RepID=UPI0032AFED83